MPPASKASKSCLIGALPRSGSWLLADALNNTGLAGQPEEYFRPDFTRLWSRRWGLRARAPYGNYIRAAIEYSTTSNGVFSAKLHWYQFEWFLEQVRALEADDDISDPELVAKWLPDPRYILLVRRDKARQAISYYRAGRSQVWFLTDDGEPPPEPEHGDDEPPDFQSIRWLEDTLIEHEDCWRDFFGQYQIEPMTIVYEDFVDNYDETVLSILDWLGIPVQTRFAIEPPGLIKQAGDETELLLSQYLTVRDAMSPKPEQTTWSRETRAYVSPELPTP
jgi:trehalose 2-sulfotransferase